MHMPSPLQIVIHTPLWVFAILAALIWLGIRNLKPRDVPLWSIFVLPLISLGFAPARIGATPDAATGLIVFLVAASVFAGAGLVAGSRVRAKLGQQNLLIGLPGSPFTLVYGLSIFAANYVLGVTFAIDRGLATDAFWGFVPALIGGALAGFVVARQGMLAGRDFQARHLVVAGQPPPNLDGSS
jgi:hypothetical protein